jgi:hypothetical protein
MMSPPLSLARTVAKMEKIMSAAYSAMLTQSCLWAFSLLVLGGLAACGATDEGAPPMLPAAGTSATVMAAQPQFTSTAGDTPVSNIESTRVPPEAIHPSNQPDLPTTLIKPPPTPLPPEALNPTEVPALVPPVPPALPTMAVAHSGDWQLYRNDQAGYSVTYPPGWTVSETVGADGSFMTTFAPAGDGANIVVLVQAGEQSSEANDIPNTRCQPVTIGGLTGARCFDTIAFSTSTTLVGHGKTYTITAAGKRTDQTTYQGLVDSFTVSS